MKYQARKDKTQMSWQTLSYLIPYLISLAITIGVSICAWRRHDVIGAALFALVALSQASRTLGYTFELVSPSLKANIFWNNPQFGGVFAWPIAFLAFSLEFTGRKLPHPKRTWELLTVVPVVSLVGKRANWREEGK